ncbi:hypothetical protein VFPBJ_11181 [Purpureocillium lilacinum]|uniref:Uncharacterized protein n=1 Tax=Purpureocillium lilacinum TaxID=33203 RepID=A0A179FKW1_PURLI|nr:hypothetical protein VFPBJ_11181 [Purpureocillium lilacinum]
MAPGRQCISRLVHRQRRLRNWCSHAPDDDPFRYKHAVAPARCRSSRAGEHRSQLRSRRQDIPTETARGVACLNWIGTLPTSIQSLNRRKQENFVARLPADLLGRQLVTHSGRATSGSLPLSGAPVACDPVQAVSRYPRLNSMVRGAELVSHSIDLKDPAWLS